MSTEGPQQPAIPLGATATDRSSRGRGRGRARSRGRGRGQGRASQSSFQQQFTVGAPSNVVDQQESQSPATALRPQGALRLADSSTDRHAATDRHFARQQDEQQSVAHRSQELRQPRQRSQRPRHRGPRHRNEQAQQASLGSARPDSTGLMLPQDSALQLPDCIICCEPSQVQGARCRLVLTPFSNYVAL